MARYKVLKKCTIPGGRFCAPGQVFEIAKAFEKCPAHFERVDLTPAQKKAKKAADAKAAKEAAALAAAAAAVVADEAAEVVAPEPEEDDTIV